MKNYEVKDNKVLKDGKPHIFRGASIADPNQINSKTDITWQQNVRELAAAGANCIRIPVLPSLYWKNVHLCSEEIVKAINLCADLGVDSIIDYHHVGAWGGRFIGDCKRFWFNIEYIMSDVKKPEKVLFEIMNEPVYEKSGRWQGSHKIVDDWAELSKHLHIIVGRLRLLNYRNICIIGSPSWALGLEGIIDNPIDLPNIMYTCHLYPKHIFDDGKGLADGYLMKGRERKYLCMIQYVAKKHPVFMTEFGFQKGGYVEGGDKRFTDILFPFMEQHGISWTAWQYSGLNGVNSETGENGDDWETSCVIYEDKKPKLLGLGEVMFNELKKHKKVLEKPPVNWELMYKELLGRTVEELMDEGRDI